MLAMVWLLDLASSWLMLLYWYLNILPCCGMLTMPSCCIFDANTFTIQYVNHHHLLHLWPSQLWSWKFLILCVCLCCGNILCVWLPSEWHFTSVTIGFQLHETYCKVCRRQQMTPVDQSEFQSLCVLLEARGVLGIKKGKETRLMKVSP